MEALIPIVLFLSIAAVLVLRPLTKRLGDLVEAQVAEKRAKRGDALPADLDGSGVQEALAGIERRLELVERRLDFTESLLDGQQDRGVLPAGGPTTQPPHPGPGRAEPPAT